jgi:hypothetical protein
MRATIKSVRTLAAALTTLGSLAGEANAALTISITEDVSGKAVITWTGVNFTTSGLATTAAPIGNNSNNFIAANPGFFTLVGSSFSWSVNGSSFAIPSFSTGLQFSGTSISTTGVGTNGIYINQSGILSTNNSYTSETSFTVSNTYNATIAELGIASGFSYSETWSNGQVFSFTVIPEPSSAILFVLSVLGYVSQRKRTS